MHPGRALAAVAIAVCALAGTCIPVSAAESRAAQEAAFMSNIDRNETANAMTGNIPYFTGSKIRLQCTVEAIVQSGVMVAQCGKEVEPVDIYVRAATEHLHTGDVLRVLGIVDTPGSWTDLLGHTVYYPIVNARFVDVITSQRH